MDAKIFQEQLTMQDVYSLLEHLGASPQETKRNVINATTVCHNHDGTGGHNLRYYEESHSFNCFSSCSHMSIYDLVGKTLDMEFYDSFKYVLSFFNQSVYDMDYQEKSYVNDIDLSFFDRKAESEVVTLNELDEKVLNPYYDMYYQGWIDEGITPKTMAKYKIKTSIIDKQIIIPHYDESDRLVGVRCRNLDDELVEEGKKYMPVFQGGNMLNHSTGSVLYGLNFNMEAINRTQKIILFESEKSVMKLDSYMPDMSIGVCLSGSNLTNKQVDIIKSLNVSEVIVALDREFNSIGDDQEKYFARKIEETFLNKLSVFANVSVIWDTKGLLNRSDSPIDKGLEVFKELLNDRIILN